MSEDELEKLRKKMLLIFLIVVGIEIVVGALLLLSGKDYDYSEIIIDLVVIGAIVYSIVNGNFSTKYKNSVMPLVVSKVLTESKYDANGGIRSDKLFAPGFLDIGNRYRADDYVSGKYKNIPVELSDVTIEYVYTDSDGDTHTETYFQGQWIIFDFNKVFKSKVAVIEKGYRYYHKIGDKIELEDADFNKQFRVLALNELEAFYILTPKMMEEIKTLNGAVKGKLIFMFYNNKLYIGIHNYKDLFKVSLFNKVNIEKYSQSALNTLTNIMKFAEVLDLSNDLFKPSTTSVDNTSVNNNNAVNTNTNVNMNTNTNTNVNINTTGIGTAVNSVNANSASINNNGANNIN